MTKNNLKVVKTAKDKDLENKEKNKALDAAIDQITDTFGKGSVQTLIPVTSKGAVRLTTARYFTPSGNSIQAKGISPDIYVPQSKLEILENNNSRREADLRGALDSENKQENNKNGNIDKDNSVNDYQLNRAIELIRSINVYENIKKAS